MTDELFTASDLRAWKHVAGLEDCYECMARHANAIHAERCYDRGFLEGSKVGDETAKKFRHENDVLIKMLRAQLEEIKASAQELFKRWDGLGPYKDDDFGEVGEQMDIFRKLLERVKG